MKTVLPKWPQVPWPTIPKPVRLTLAERVARIEWYLRGPEPSVRELIWMADREGRLAEARKIPLPLCERRRDTRPG